MESSSVELEDIGDSKILSRQQRQWLDGDETVLQKTPERQIWHRIRGRVDSAWTELQFIQERMPAGQLAKIGRSDDESKIPTLYQPVNEEVAPRLQGSAKAIGASAGMDGAVDMVSDGFEDVTEDDDSAKMVAKQMKRVFQEKGYSKEQYPEVWEAFSKEVARHLIE